MTWHYLILTASNDLQATAYRGQLELRQRLGLLHGFEHVLVVPDPGGRRVGSGGSTIASLRAILAHEEETLPLGTVRTLSDLRILIIHAGGDSRRLPAYGQCGKIFVPLPGETDSPVATTLFDRQLPVYRELPAPSEGRGQVVITSGDVLLDFPAHQVSFAPDGISGLACAAPPEQAAYHGVYCRGHNDTVRRFLQKPSIREQHEAGAVSASGHSLLDLGVIEFDGATAQRLLQWQEMVVGGSKREDRSGEQGDRRWEMGEADAVWKASGGNGTRHSDLQPSPSDFPALPLDFYREICCALGTETTLDSYIAAARAAGSRWDEAELERLYEFVASIASHVHVLPHCHFHHFGTTRQIISSGQELVRQANGFGPRKRCLAVNSRLANEEAVATVDAWVEGCTIEGPLSLGGENLLVGVVESDAVDLPPGACLDLLPGRNRHGQPVTFVRCYRRDDTLTASGDEKAIFCGWPIRRWLDSATIGGDEIWDPALPDHDRTLWHARLFPAVEADRDYRGWLWMFEPHVASPGQWQEWGEADRFSLAEMAELADLEAFTARRVQNRCQLVRNSLRRHFAHSSGFSAAELAYMFQHVLDPTALLGEVLTEAYEHTLRSASAPVQETFVASRILHTLGTAVGMLGSPYGDVAGTAPSTTVPSASPIPQRECNIGWADSGALLSTHHLRDLEKVLDRDVLRWLVRHGLYWSEMTVAEWADNLRSAAMEQLRSTIVTSGSTPLERPRPAIRRDEIVWGRIPARLDLAGGWTDTPPYSLEHGGRVLNAAVLLNGQPPIQVYGRLTSEPLIRLRSIDVGSDLEIRRWEQLLDYTSATGEFSLVKAALAQCGFTPESIGSPPGDSLQEALAAFGGGLELSTLAAIPKGSGLGTSSIMGALILRVIHRILGRDLSRNELFHGVLRMEQELTTGGGWQDQIGGVAGGLKLVSTDADLVPDATIRYLPTDILDPRTNGGCTLLYYTGITRLAKNILEEVVGRYLNRDREAMAVLGQLRNAASEMAEAISRKDLAKFGGLVDRVWRLNVRLDPNSTTEEIEDLLDRARPWIWGGKLLGAGGGGFLLLICRSADDASRLREDFERDPPNELARFFDFTVCEEGLCVSVC